MLGGSYGGREDFVGHTAPVLLQDLQFGRGRRAAGAELAVGEVALHPAVLAVQDVLLKPLEVIQVRQRQPYFRIAELGPAHVEADALRSERPLVGDRPLLDPAVADLGNVVAGRPALRPVLLPEVVRSALERFEHDVVVAIEVGPHGVEVVLPDIDRQILAPIVGHPLIGDRAARIDRLDLVGTTGQRRLQRGLPDIPVIRGPPMLRLRRQDAGGADQRLHFAPGLEADLQAMLVQRLDLLDILKEALEEGAAMLLDRVPAEHEVGSGHGVAVVEFGFMAAG